MKKALAILAVLAALVLTGCGATGFKRSAAGVDVYSLGIAQDVTVTVTHTGDASNQADKPIAMDLARELGKGADVSLPISP